MYADFEDIETRAQEMEAEVERLRGIIDWKDDELKDMTRDLALANDRIRGLDEQVHDYQQLAAQAIKKLEALEKYITPLYDDLDTITGSKK